MDLLELIKFKNEYNTFIEKWESTNELSKYLSYMKPKYLRKSYLSHIQPDYLKESDLEEGYFCPSPRKGGIGKSLIR